MKLERISTVALALGAAFAAGPAGAETALGNLGVSATIVTECAVAGGLLDFGELDISGSNEASADISVTCTAETEYDIGLGDGANSTNTPSYTRRMAQGADFLPYALFTDDQHENAIGTTSAINLAEDQAATGLPQEYTVYGTVDGADAVGLPAGDYTDTVQITVTF